MQVSCVPRWPREAGPVVHPFDPPSLNSSRGVFSTCAGSPQAHTPSLRCPKLTIKVLVRRPPGAGNCSPLWPYDAKSISSRILSGCKSCSSGVCSCRTGFCTVSLQDATSRFKESFWGVEVDDSLVLAHRTLLLLFPPWFPSLPQMRGLFFQGE